MDKYRKSAEEKLGGKVHPDLLARQALVDASFAQKEREDFFDKVYGDLLVDYFIEFLKTEPHENKKREFIYSSCLGLGDIKTRLTRYEMYASNIPYIKPEDIGDE